ncbi:MAG: hypothetical protein ABI583_09765, partial [Betaproteobacteria bacterium]
MSLHHATFPDQTVSATAPAAIVCPISNSGAGALHFLAGVAMLSLLSGCGPGGPQGQHGGFPPPSVTYEVVAPHEVAVNQEYVGQTAGSREIEIRARVNGIVEKRLFEEGAVIKSG